MVELRLGTVIKTIERVANHLHVILGIAGIAKADNARLAVVQHAILHEDGAYALAAPFFDNDDRNHCGDDNEPPDDGDDEVDRVDERKLEVVPEPEKFNREQYENRNDDDVAFAQGCLFSQNMREISTHTNDDILLENKRKAGQIVGLSAEENMPVIT